MPRRLVIALTSRSSLVVLCALLALLMAQGSWDILEDAAFIQEMQRPMEDILAGLSTILVAYGVVLEERETLLRFLRVYPGELTPLQERVDHLCRGYGLLVILLGMFVGVFVYLIRMPDLNLVDFDVPLILLGTFLCLINGGLLVRLAWLLWRAPRDLAPAAPDS